LEKVADWRVVRSALGGITVRLPQKALERHHTLQRQPRRGHQSLLTLGSPWVETEPPSAYSPPTPALMYYRTAQRGNSSVPPLGPLLSTLQRLGDAEIQHGLPLTSGQASVVNDRALKSP